MTDPQCRRVVVVTGLSGGGKASVLHALEDAGYEAVDNPPLRMLEDMVTRSDRKLAVGIDARTTGFDAAQVLAVLERLRANPDLRPELVYTTADEATLMRRYTETRRRHPLAPQGRVADGIAAEQAITARLRDGADLVIDTSELSLAALRQLIERVFGSESEGDGSRLVVSLVSFAFARGLPREADLVFDARFLRNPFYDPILRGRTGLDPDVAEYIEADPDCEAFFQKIVELIELVLPRFVQEGKKYATLTIGCTGGRHRSVYLIERLSAHLARQIALDHTRLQPGRSEHPARGPGMDWRLHVTHRELARDGQALSSLTDRPAQRRDASETDPRDKDEGRLPSPVQAQEA
jgi:UPF0042 nucleotide-binding protein